MKRTIENKIKDANEILLSSKDSYDYSPYMFGLYNGMELMLSIFEEREPKFLDTPEIWGQDAEELGELESTQNV